MTAGYRRDFFRSVLPSVLAFALSGVYAIVDGFFVGNALGDSALAAVNLAFPLTAFLQAAGTGLGMAGAIRYSVCSGAEDFPGRRRALGAGLTLLGAAGALLTAAYLLLGTQALSLFGARGGVLELAEEYLLWVALGAVFQVLGTGLVPFLRNMGRAVAAMAEEAHARGVSVEGELGVLGGQEDHVFAATSTYTNPLDAVKFIQETEVDGRKRTYRLTDKGRQAYHEELDRLRACVLDGEEEER